MAERREVVVDDPDLGEVRLRGLSRGQLRGILLELDRVDIDATLREMEASGELYTPADPAAAAIPLRERVRAALFAHKVVKLAVVGPRPALLDAPEGAEALHRLSSRAMSISATVPGGGAR